MTPRLLCQLPETGGTVTATAEQSHYLLKVLRLELGDAVQIFDGQGLRFEAKIQGIEGKAVQLLVEPGRRHHLYERPTIWLLQGLPSGDKMDWIIEKSVELGVSRFSPMECERSIVRLSGPRLVKKMIHWRAQIEAACMQSQRDDLMLLDEAQSSEACFNRFNGATLKFLLHPEAPLNLLEALRTMRHATPPASSKSPMAAASLVLAIGPESGFSQGERSIARRAGFSEVNLGAQILRTETAALVATAKLQAWLEVI
jgi:16S rRNA (uracil1498-N3)-methyltransferase